jgi:hypothetical protein
VLRKRTIRGPSKRSVLKWIGTAMAWIFASVVWLMIAIPAIVLVGGLALFVLTFIFGVMLGGAR